MLDFNADIYSLGNQSSTNNFPTIVRRLAKRASWVGKALLMIEFMRRLGRWWLDCRDGCLSEKNVFGKLCWRWKLQTFLPLTVIIVNFNLYGFNFIWLRFYGGMWSEKLFMSQAGITWTPETLSIRTWCLQKESALWYEIIKCLSIKKEKSPDYENRKVFLLPVVAFRCFMIKNQRSRNARLCNASCCTLRIEVINFWDVTRLKKVML